MGLGFMLAAALGLILIGALLRAQIMAALALLIHGLALWIALRLILVWLPALDYRAPLVGGLIGGAIGFLVVGVACAGLIRHALIRFYMHRAIQRDRDAAQAGKLW